MNIKTVQLGGQKYRIGPTDVLGSGGEATVVRINNQAVKIYHQVNSARISKLQDFIRAGIHLPDGVCAPTEIAYNTAGDPVGFAMRLLTGHNEVVQKLSSKSYRKSNPHFNSRFIAELFLDAYQITQKCHAAGVVIGDYNDLNVMFSKYATFIDADSFQFGRHPCMVGTEQFLDPYLYNLDLGKKPYFKPENDWYSWFCMLVRSLIMAHPYGGVHNKYATIPQRAEARITLFDDGVKYPKAAYNPKLLDDNLLAIFDRLFKKGERFIPDLAAIEQYRESLIDCPSCLIAYPATQKNCPQCATINVQQVRRKAHALTTAKGTVSVEEMISTPGEIIWHKIYYKNIFAIANENMVYVLYQKIPDQAVIRKPVFSVKSQAKFDMFDGRYLVVSQSPEENDILVLDTSKDTPVGVDKKPASLFDGERVFACSKEHLIRGYEGFLFRGTFNPKFNCYADDNIGAIMKNQCWVAASPFGNEVFGMQRIFSAYSFFKYEFDEKSRIKLFNGNIELEQNESIIDSSLRFFGTAVLLLLKTEIFGRTYTRVYIINQGTITSQFRVEALGSDIYRNIHGKAFVYGGGRSTVLHPTDNGVVQEVINSQRTETIHASTEPFVTESDFLLPYEKGILVVGDKNINYLTMA